MKVEEVPQDLKYFKGTVVRDVDYAVDADGNYQMVVSDGWMPKNEALEVTMADIDEQCREILQRVKAGESSPLEYHAARNLMDVSLLSDYTGFSKRTIRKHFLPGNFEKLDEKTLEVYADVLRITVAELTSIPETINHKPSTINHQP